MKKRTSPLIRILALALACLFPATTWAQPRLNDEQKQALCEQNAPVILDRKVEKPASRDPRPLLKEMDGLVHRTEQAKTDIARINELVQMKTRLEVEEKELASLNQTNLKSAAILGMERRQKINEAIALARELDRRGMVKGYRVADACSDVLVEKVRKLEALTREITKFEGGPLQSPPKAAPRNPRPRGT